MKLTLEQEALMRRLCMERKGNAEIASAVGVPINEVWAWRSRNKLTRKAVEQLLEAEQNECPPPKAPKDQGDVVTDIEMPLLLMIQKCGGKLDNFCRYFCEVFNRPEVCEHCKANKEHCGEVTACAPALADYIRTEEFSCGK